MLYDIIWHKRRKPKKKPAVPADGETSEPASYNCNDYKKVFGLAESLPEPVDYSLSSEDGKVVKIPTPWVGISPPPSNHRQPICDRRLALVFLLAFTYALTSGCGGTSFPTGSTVGGEATGESGSDVGGGIDTGGGSEGDSSDDSSSTGSSSSDSSSSDSGSSDTPSALPPASIPLDWVTKSNMVIGSEDSSGAVPVIGFEDAVDTSGMSDSDGDGEVEGYQVVVATESLELSSLSFPPHPMSSRRKSGSSNFKYFWIPAFAGMTSFVITEAHAQESTDICDEEGVACCGIKTDGSFACYPTGSNSNTYYVYITDGESLSDVVTDSPNPNFLWLANSPTDVTLADDTLYSITDGIAVKTSVSSDGNIRVDGDHADASGAYRDFDVTGTNLAYDASNEYLGVMDLASGVTALDLTGTLAGSRTIDGATAYTKIKNSTFNKVYFGAEISSGTEASVYYYYFNVFSASTTFSEDDIRFIQAGDTDNNGNQLTHAKTISFDVNSEGWALVVYKDNAGNFRIRASNDTVDGDRFGGELPIILANVSSTTPNFKDIHFINDEKALLIDDANDMVWVITLDTTNQTVTYNLNGSSNGISVGDGPVAFAFNADKSRANILNQTGESVSVINVKNSDGSVRSAPAVVATKNLIDLVAGKTLTFTPNVIARSGSDAAIQLIIGCETTKSLLLLDMADITEAPLVDEDNDADGYTGAEGDCDDNDATLNPTTVWYRDSDSDGFGNSSSTTAQCEQPTGYLEDATDCNDSASTTYPEASELCDSVDNDCDDSVDDGVATVTWYADSDGDGYGNSASTTSNCAQPSGYVSNSTDCNDTSASVSPADTEVCNDSIDNDCDGSIDENCYTPVDE